MMDFLSYLDQHRILMMDGAMGTELAKKGFEPDTTVNLNHPEEVFQVHRAYVEAGSDILITNSLIYNRIYIETHESGVDPLLVNQAAARLARRAAGTDKWVFGDISSTGQMLEPYGEYQETQFYQAFKEQAEILAQNGVDGFIIETMIDLREAICALKACRAISDLPVIVSLSFATTGGGGRTIMGNSAREFAQAAADHGATVIGINCGDSTPAEMAEIVATLRAESNLPIAVQPNAGKPVLVNDETRFDMTPLDFAAGVGQCIAAGARLVGGCCGTTPAHIRALSEFIQTNYPCPASFARS